MRTFYLSLSRICLGLLLTCLLVPAALPAQDAVRDLMHTSEKFLATNRDSALDYADRAIRMAKFEERDKALANALRWRGKIFLEKNMYQAAKQDIREGFVVDSLVHHREGKAKSLLLLGHLYVELDTLDSARVFFESALQLLDANRDKPEIVRVWVELGKMKEKDGDRIGTRSAYRKALEIANETEQATLIGLVNQRLGFYYLDLKKNSLAKAHLRDAMSNFEQVDDEEQTARSIYGLACVDRLDKKYTVAENYAQRGLKQAKAIGSRGLTMQFYQLLGDLKKDQGLHEAASEFYQLNILIRDSLLGNADARDLSNVIAKYEQEKLKLENEKKAQEIELQKATIALGKKELQNERLWFYFILGGLILVALFGGVLARAVILKNRANRRLQAALDNLQRAQNQLIRTEKLASLGQVTAGIAHEIRNPLNFVNSLSKLSVGMVDEVAEELTDLKGQAFDGPPAGMVFEYFQDIRMNTGKVLEHGQRASRIVTDMLQHAGKGESEKEMVEVNAFVEEYVQLAFHSMRGQDDAFDCRIDYALAEAAGSVSLVRSEMGRALLNIAGNAFEAMAGRLATGEADYKPRLLVRTRRVGKMLEICLADNGPGVPAEHREKVFEPFFTTKPPNKGTGLGLSLAFETVVTAHRGALVLQDADGGGAEFVIRIPLGE